MNNVNLFQVKDRAWIDAPVERVFQLSTNVELVRQTLKMRPVAGRTTGRVLAGDTVAWRGWKFGFPQRHTSVISGYNAPMFFQDTQVRGRFRHFQHDHHLRAEGGGTMVWDEVRFSLPFGMLGRMVAKYVLAPLIARLVRQRFALLKRLAEGEEWRGYVGD